MAVKKAVCTGFNVAASLLFDLAAAAQAGRMLVQRSTGRMVAKVAVANLEPNFPTVNGGMCCGAVERGH